MKKFVISLSLLISSIVYLNAQTRVPFQVALVYPLGTNGTNTDVINNTSINIFAGMATGVEGVEIGGFANINKKDVNGVQVSGYLNVTGGNTNGIAVAGFSNISQSAQGVQIAGFLNTAGTGTNKLVQLAGFANATSTIEGVQLAGFMNFGQKVNGFQVSGFVNVAQSISGPQLAGFVNVACDTSCFQLAGFSNVSSGNAGSQVSAFLNVARKSNGCQIGFVNIADSSSNQIGFINLARNSSEQIAVWTDELLTTNIAFKSGGRHFYGYLGLSLGVDDHLRYGANAGLGIRSYLTEKVRVDMELSSKFLVKDFDEKVDNHSDIKHFNSSSFKALLVIPIGSRIEIFAGPSINYRYTNSSEGAKIPSDLSIWKENNASKSRFQQIYAGATGGIAVKIN